MAATQVQLRWMSNEGIKTAQETVTKYHYLHKPIDSRCSVQGYNFFVGDDWAGLFLFGRPQATRCYPWYGSVEDVMAGRAEVTYWQVLNLARVFVNPEFQKGGTLYGKTPGFKDRRGKWRSTLISTALDQALDKIRVDYLLARPPCFLDQPYQIDYCLSYCDTRLHKGTIYQSAGFELYNSGNQYIQSWRKALEPLSLSEMEQIEAVSESSTRSQKYRFQRQLAEQVGQLSLF